MLADGTTGQKLICTRYIVGLPQLNLDSIASFRHQMSGYRDALASAVRSPNAAAHLNGTSGLERLGP